MISASQRAKALQCRDMHTSRDLLVRPNAWDAGSARIFEQAGFRAIGTTSAGIAYALGYADGERMHREVMLEAVRRITRVVAVLVPADCEAGYADTMEELAETVQAAIDAGAVGINLEDSQPRDGQLIAVDRMVEKIHTIRRVAEAAGLALLINARTDVYVHAIGAPASRFEHAVSRVNALSRGGR
jgi:2-methylisocitrate lyase-like PEP mutase family enzyme